MVGPANTDALPLASSTWTLLAMDDGAGLAGTTGCNGYGGEYERDSEDFRTVAVLMSEPAQHQR